MVKTRKTVRVAEFSVFLKAGFASRLLRTSPPLFSVQVSISPELPGTTPKVEMGKSPKQGCDSHWNFCCKSGETLPLEMRCNGIDECEDRSDEANCPAVCSPPKFRCNNGACLEESEVCDGIDHCPNKADERNCKDKCRQKGLFECQADGTCITLGKLCDKKKDCSDGADETDDKCPVTPPTVANACKLEILRRKKHEMVFLSRSLNGQSEWCSSGPLISHFIYYLNEISIVFSFQACYADEFKCGSGKCIHLYQLCDGVSDCDDGADENKHTCQKLDCSKAGCSQTCYTEDSGAVKCSCRHGYRLMKDGKACVDVNECIETPEVCSQFCENLKGSYDCSCAAGFLKNARGECRVENRDTRLLTVENGVVESIHMNRNRDLIFNSPNSHIGGIDYDVASSTVFVSDATKNKIYRIPLDKSDSRLRQIDFDLLKPGVLALDWVTGNLYVADFRPSIHVCKYYFKNDPAKTKVHCKILTEIEWKGSPLDGIEPTITSIALVPDAG